MTVIVTVAVTFLFFFFFGFKISNEAIMLGAENDQNGALFILKEEKREKRKVNNGLETGEIADLSYFLFLYFSFL